MCLKDIKLKPEGGKPRLLDRVVRLPKTAMKDMWLKSRQKAVEETKGTPFAGQQGESSNAPANRAGEQILSGAKGIAQKSADLTLQGGKKMVRSIRTKPSMSVKATNRSIKEVSRAAKGMKIVQHSVQTAQKTAQAAAKATQKAAQAARTATKAAAAGIKAAAKATVTAVKSTIAAVKGLGAIIAAGGWVAVLIIVIICAVAMIIGTCFDNPSGECPVYRLGYSECYIID